MKLPIPFLNSKKSNSQYYLALILSDEKASAVILIESEGNLKKISSHEEFFHMSIEDLGKEDFISMIDKTISRAEEVLPPEIETHQTVFGVKANWVDQDTKKIKKEYLEKLKKVCDALDLSPIGFMVTSEAITHLLQEDEGAPLSAVFAEIGKSVITLSLFRGGKVIETVSSPHGDSAPATVDKLLSHFTVPVLPARIILFLNKPDERTQQAFIAHHWSKSLPFLHMPQVTVLPVKYDNKAVMFGAATQMGFKVINEAPESIPHLNADEVAEEEAFAELETAPHQKEDLLSEAENKAEDESNPEPEVENDDAAHETPESTEEKGGDFGFVLNGEATDKPPVSSHMMNEEVRSHHRDDEPDYQPITHRRADEPEEEELHENHHAATKRGMKIPFVAALSSLSLPKNIKLPNLGKFKGQKGLLKFAIPVIAVVLLITGLSYYYLNVVKATVLLTVTPKTVTQDETVDFSTTASSDYSKNVVAADVVSASVDGSTSTPATGKKDVGDKAKGSVTIYNNGSDPVTLSSGSEITAASGQVFILDGSVKVPASSGDIFTGTKPGTADGSVTAKTLGTESNVPSGTRFSVGSNSDLAAKNDNAFSGGTKKNVVVVSSNDLAKLKADLPKKMQGSAQSALSQKAQSGETLLPITGSTTLEKVKFDKKEGDEAKTVTLTASIVFSGIAYKNDELNNFAESILKGKYDQDATFAKDSLKESVKNVSQKNAKTAEGTVTIEAGLLPKIDTQDIVTNIQDKSLGKAQETLANIPQVSKTDITFSPPIPLLPNLFPKLPKQISVEVKTK